MKREVWKVLLIAGVILLTLPLPAEKAKSDKKSLEALLLEINLRHPRIQSRARELAAKLEAAKFKSWKYPDPKIGVFWLNAPYKRDLRFIKDKTPMTGIEYRLMQPIPFPGRLTVRSHIADYNAAMSRLRLGIEKNKLTGEFLGHLIEAATLQRTLDLARRYTKNMKVVAIVAKTRYSVGRGNLADVARANLSYTSYRDKVLRLKGSFDSHIRRLIYYLTESEETRKGKGKKSNKTQNEKNRVLIQSLIASGSLEAYLENLRKQVLKSRDVKGSSLNVALSKLKSKRQDKHTTLARMDYLPDFEIFAAYRKRAYIENDPVPGEKFMSFGITARIPLWTALSNHYKVGEKSKRLMAKRLSTENIEELVQTSFDAIGIKYIAWNNRIKLHGDKLIPQGKRALESARLAYQTGKVDFDVFLKGWNVLFKLEARRYRLIAAREKQLLTMASIINLILPVYKGARK